MVARLGSTQVVREPAATPPPAPMGAIRGAIVAVVQIVERTATARPRPERLPRRADAFMVPQPVPGRPGQFLVDSRLSRLSCSPSLIRSLLRTRGGELSASVPTDGMDQRRAPMDAGEAQRRFAERLEEAALPPFVSAEHDPELDLLKVTWAHGVTLYMDLTRDGIVEPIDEHGRGPPARKASANHRH